MERTNVLIVVFMMQGVYTWEEHVSDFALGIQNTCSFEEYFMLWRQCFIPWPQKTDHKILSLPFWYVLRFCRSDIIKVFCLKKCNPQIFVFQPKNPNYR